MTPLRSFVNHADKRAYLEVGGGRWLLLLLNDDYVSTVSSHLIPCYLTLEDEAFLERFYERLG